MSKEKIYIFDTTLRDGAQTEGVNFSLDDKNKIAKALSDLGVDYLDPMYDDLNTPGYIANLHKLFEKSQKGALKDKEIFTSACSFIGLLTNTKEEWTEFKKSKSVLSEKEILLKIK